MPTLAELMLAELDHEMPGTRRTLERVPEGQKDWKPHDKSTALGYLAGLVASMPGWIVSMVKDDHLDLAAPGRFATPTSDSAKELLRIFDEAVAGARQALAGVTDDRLLNSTWRLLMKGEVLVQQTRYEAVRVSALNHLYHHRTQLTMYLRLNEEPVPALYGPSADETVPVP